MRRGRGDPPNAFPGTPAVLALDFDGVICDTVHETLRSTWQVYRQIWGAADSDPPPEVADAFVRVRPALEIGWESPILLRAIIEGVPEASLLHDFQATWRARIAEAHRLNRADLEARFDAARDAWIQADLPGWLAAQAFYPGVADRLRAILVTGARVFILTTKEGRFAHKLLEANGVTLPTAHVWGKEQARPKADLLRGLGQGRPGDSAGVWFVEDRLRTLRSVQQQPDLEEIGLFLASWGYNTPKERDEAARDSRIVLLSLSQFCGDFHAWVPAGTRGDRAPRGEP
jgi:phosphoglycolate phosphatase-like HAD superfamily hydrolase